MDSEAGLAIFLCLVALKLRTTPELETENIELLLAALQKRSGALCHGIIDLKYSFNPVSKDRSLMCHVLNNRSKWRCNWPVWNDDLPPYLNNVVTFVIITISSFFSHVVKTKNIYPDEFTVWNFSAHDFLLLVLFVDEKRRKWSVRTEGTQQ